jgi:hypothetical protein
MRGEEENKRKSFFIDIFDINGQSISLHLFGKEKYKTFIGSVSGLLSLILMMGISIYFVMDLFQRKSLSIIFNEDNNQLPLNNLSNVPIMVTLGDLSSNILDPEGLYWIDAKVMNYKRVIINGTAKFFLELIPIELEKCNITKHFLDQSEMFKNLAISKYQCIPPGKYNITLFGRFGDTVNGWSYLAFFLNKCNAKMGQKCLNDSYIESTLANTALSIAYSSYSINHYNVTTPNQAKIDTTMFLMSSTLLKNYYYNLRQVIYETDYGILFEDRQKESFYTYFSQSVDVSLKAVGVPTAGPNIGYVIIKNADPISFYNRNYIKIQAVMANIGGIIKAVMIFCKIVSDFLTRKMIYLDIANRIFHFNFNEDNSQNKNNKLKIIHSREPSSATLAMESKTSKDLKGDNLSNNFQKNLASYRKR